MFTGIVQNLGTLESMEETEAGLHVKIHSTLDTSHFHRGNSIAVDGVCLTVEDYNPQNQTFEATIVPETLKKTTLGALKGGQALNIEAPLTLSTPIAGHLVSGHVDGVGEVLETEPVLSVRVPRELQKFCAPKGSITLNGVSLTLAESISEGVKIALIPETKAKTNLGLLAKGSKVNIEIDQIARYLEHLIISHG